MIGVVSVSAFPLQPLVLKTTTTFTFARALKCRGSSSKGSTRSSSNHQVPLRGPPNRKKNTTTSDVLHLMDSLNLSIPTHTYACLVKECTLLRDPHTAAHLHTHISSSNNTAIPLSLANRLLLMYANCGHLHLARQLFDEMPLKDSISWATILATYLDNHHYNQALLLFQHPQSSSLFTNFTKTTTLTIIASCILKASIRTNHFALGNQLHACLLKSKLINNLHLWTSMILFYCKQENFHKVVQLFKENNNNIIFSSIIPACGRMRDGLGFGKQLHACAIKRGVVESDVFVQSGLVDMYGKCGMLEDARRVFDMISRKEKTNVVCWYAMLMGYTQHGCCKEAIKLLYEMKAAGIQPQESMINQVRIACAFDHNYVY